MIVSLDDIIEIKGLIDFKLPASHQVIEITLRGCSKYFKVGEEIKIPTLDNSFLGGKYIKGTISKITYNSYTVIESSGFKTIPAYTVIKLVRLEVL